MAEFAHNNREHSTKGMSPFYITMGYHPKMFPLTFDKTKTPNLDERLIAIGKARDEATAAHENARRIMRERFTGSWQPFKQGEKVWLEGTNIRVSHGSKKLSPKRHGPFKITHIYPKHAYRLQLPKSWEQKKIHPVFHASKLTPYRETQEHGRNYTELPPDVIEGEEEWEIEAITGHRLIRGKTEYLVHWKGYPNSEDMWMKAAELKHAQTMLNSYKRLHKIR